MRQTLQKAGLDDSKYASHSFQIGVAMSAAACDLQNSLIKTLGHWESEAYTLYIRTLRETLYQVSHQLVEVGIKDWSEQCVWQEES